MNKTLLVLSVLLVAGLAMPSFEEFNTLWNTWKIQFDKFYAADEEPLRFAIFVDNYNKIVRFNAENEDVKFGLNQFADLTGSEFKATHASCAHAANEVFAESLTLEQIYGDLPDSVDWRAKGAVTAVKDQGQCGSCWTFSTTGVIEGSYFIRHQSLVSFSEQQIVDCDTKDGNEGCDGGWPYLAVEYAINQGLEKESDYPYRAVDGTCKYDSSKAVSVATNYSFVTPNSTVALKTALVDSPVSVLIEADQDVFQFYKSGAIHANCGAQLDHAVLAVGYGKEGLYDSFIVKNSWGTSWGKSGYVYIATTNSANSGQGVCGILAQPLVVQDSN